MATLYICVFEGASEVALGDPVQEDTVTVGGTSQQSAAIDNGSANAANKRMRLRVATDTDCFVTWGADPTAQNDGSDGRPLWADNPEYFDVEAGHKLAVIQMP